MYTTKSSLNRANSSMSMENFMKSSSFHQFFANIPNLTVVPIGEPIPIDVITGN